MNKIKDKLKKTYFFVNKIYLYIIFLILAGIDLSLGGYYFIISVVIFLGKRLTSHLPFQIKETLKYKTYIYKKSDNRNLKIDIWYPVDHMKESYPLVFFCHGGGWVSGFRNQANNVSWCKYLASEGFCASSIDYRYGIKNNMDDILSDYTDALNFIKKNNSNLKIDRNKIVLMGLSAGGHLSLLYSTYNSFIDDKEKMEGIKGVVAYYSPSDLNDMFVPENKSLFARFATKRTLKANPLEKKELYDYYSPINWVSKRMIPCLMVHGKLDTTVPFSSSLKFLDKLKKNNVYSNILVHEQGGHSFDTNTKDETTINILKNTMNFIKKLVR